ncbi:ankyrin repeat-containing domain protein [Fusarium solani]|uniref:Ankyrin repeat-containing domain protein n=1 Tax=Fusarium solani TaxID=169388 RepID=A0A9P9R7I6_FUSSL|nr:ankyrin repeat-containing domain protein [Fusarium solani]KAH7268717.1 ankyrin repeat-containing domain protein [Fusarium solani]
MFSIQQFLPYASVGQVEFVVDSIQASIDDYKRNSNVVERKTIPFSLFPLEEFYPFGGGVLYLPHHETRLNVTPMHFAAVRGKHDVVAFLLKLLKSRSVNDKHQEASALSLALYSENFHVAKLLLKGGAQAGCGLLINGLHAAARLGLKDEIEFFVKHHGVDVDVQDKDGATPVVHALRLPEDEARETIRLLFELGAVPDLEIGKWAWTYSDLARAMGKLTLAEELADRVLEAADEASDDDSSCTMTIER